VKDDIYNHWGEANWKRIQDLYGIHVLGYIRRLRPFYFELNKIDGSNFLMYKESVLYGKRDEDLLSIDEFENQINNAS